MNAEIIMAMNKKEKKHPVRKWWNENSYKVYRVIFFPIWIGAIAIDKTNKYLNSRQKWSEERAKEILNYYIPRRADWCAEDKTFYFFVNGMSWGKLAKKHLKRKDRRWWNLHTGWTGGKIRNYLLNEFELEGFTKEIGNCYDGRTEVSFTMIEK